MQKLKETDKGKALDDGAFYDMLTNKWESLIHSTTDTQGAGMLSLNRARKDNGLFLLHEN